MHLHVWPKSVQPMYIALHSEVWTLVTFLVWSLWHHLVKTFSAEKKSNPLKKDTLLVCCLAPGVHPHAVTKTIPLSGTVTGIFAIGAVVAAFPADRLAC